MNIAQAYTDTAIRRVMSSRVRDGISILSDGEVYRPDPMPTGWGDTYAYEGQLRRDDLTVTGTVINSGSINVDRIDGYHMVDGLRVHPPNPESWVGVDEGSGDATGMIMGGTLPFDATDYLNNFQDRISNALGVPARMIMGDNISDMVAGMNASGMIMPMDNMVMTTVVRSIRAEQMYELTLDDGTVIRTTGFSFREVDANEPSNQDVPTEPHEDLLRHGIHRPSPSNYVD